MSAIVWIVTTTEGIDVEDYKELHSWATEADARSLFDDEAQAVRRGDYELGCTRVRLLRCEVVAELVEHLDGTLAVESADLPPPTGPIWPTTEERIANMLDAAGIPRAEFAWHDGSDEALSLEDRVAMLVEQAGVRTALPKPTGNGRPVLPDVLALPGLTGAARAVIDAQAAKGQIKYGRPLGYDDGRGPRDLHEELADALMYAMREYGPDHTLTRSALSLLLQALRVAERDDDNPEARDAQAMRMGRWIEGREVSDG